jgi:hypothetical protein
MDINYAAVAVAAVSAFLIGGIWYSPLLFHRPWMAANGFAPVDLEKGNTGAVFGLAFVSSLVLAASLAVLLAPHDTSVVDGARLGAIAGFGIAAMAIAVVAQFERRPPAYTLINGAYWVVSTTVMGAIIGAWR